MSYASALKSKTIKPVVVIKPKEKQQCKKTLDEITNKIKSNEVNVCNTRSIRDGGIVLSCTDANETVKMKQLIEMNFGENYNVELPKINKPRIRISNICKNIPKELIIDKLKENNHEIDFEMNLIAVIERKKFSNSWFDIIVEVNGNAYKKLINIGILKLPWRECKVFEHLHLKRCYKCCGFSHLAKSCKRDQVCCNCSGSHKLVDCKSKKSTCINCKYSNDKLNTNFDINHHAYSKTCAILQRRLGSLKNKIEYNESNE